MIIRLYVALLFLPVFALLGDVTRFLEPMKLSVGSSHTFTKLKSSAYVHPSTRDYKHATQVIRSNKILLDRLLIEKQLGEALSHRYQAAGEVAAFLTRQWKSVTVGTNFIVKIQDCLPDELTSSTFVRFSIWNEGILVGQFAEPIKLAHYLNVYFSKMPIERGSRLTPSMFLERPVDVLKQYAGSVPGKSPLNGYQLGSSIKASTPLKWNHLSKVTLVRKGKIVNVFASGNGIYVTMKGMSMEDGVEGGMVIIRNLSSEKEFQAKVLNENSVKVHL